ncbi:MAG TPA: Rieske (2Fe-2S) protein [Solirubrobacteraceae bacterium]|nr:Rieske (2Fe-2S) protein [Solirubrobacteraceae bacterium]
MADRKPRATELADRIAELEPLDSVAEPIASTVRDLLPGGPVKDALSGTWLGHALHPIMQLAPLGTWMSAVILDLIGGEDGEPAADLLIGTGLLSAVPTFVSGWSDYSDSTVASASVRRVGIVHAAANGTGALLFAGSLLARGRGRRGKGKLLALAGMGAVGAGGWLGGHLSYAEGVGVDVTTFEDYPGDWTPVIAEAELADGEPHRAEVGGVGVMVVRDGGHVYALADRCAHRGGPLSDGEIEDGCVTCPWHGSRFRLSDGSVEQGPAAYPQPALDARISGGMVEVRDRTP